MRSDRGREALIKIIEWVIRSQQINLLIGEIQQRRIELKKKIRKLNIIMVALGLFGILITILPAILGKKLTCQEMDTAPFYEKWHYYTHPLIIHPCDSTSPFGVHNK